MFSTALIALVASVVSVSATANLSLKVAGPKSKGGVGVDALKVVATVTNTGDETLKLLNDPRGILSQLPTHAFDITTADGSRPAFTGAKVKYSPDYVVKKNKESSFTVLAPGETFNVTHELGAAYNFLTSGAGDYTFEASNLFHYVNDVGKVVELRADNEATNLKVAGVLSGKRNSKPTRAYSRGMGKRATFDGCASDQESALGDAISAAEDYAAGANSYAQGLSDATERYSTWFGEWDEGRASTIKEHYSNIDSNDFSTFTFNCACTDDSFAFVYPDQFGTITVCNAFWDAPTTGTDSKGGTIIHESSHFTKNGGTEDNVYGQEGAKSLAKSNPGSAIMNADSHEYFAENNPALN